VGLNDTLYLKPLLHLFSRLKSSLKDLEYTSHFIFYFFVAKWTFRNFIQTFHSDIIHSDISEKIRVTFYYWFTSSQIPYKYFDTLLLLRVPPRRWLPEGTNVWRVILDEHNVTDRQMWKDCWERLNTEFGDPMTVLHPSLIATRFSTIKGRMSNDLR
jgi:hypothetical protein